MPSLPQGLAGCWVVIKGGFVVDLKAVQDRVVVKDRVINQWHKEANK